MTATVLHPFSMARVERAVEKVTERLHRATAALEAAGVGYAVAGGNAVALWVARVDESAVRNTRDVDVLLDRGDLPAATAALEAAGFVYRHVGGVDVFLDGPDAKAREGVHVVFAGEKICGCEPAMNPLLEESEAGERFRALTLPALLRVKLDMFRRIDRVHLRDMIDVGLIDATWLPRLTDEIGGKPQRTTRRPAGLMAAQRGPARRERNPLLPASICPRRLRRGAGTSINPVCSGMLGTSKTWS